MSFLFVDVSENNTEKNMEAFEEMIKDTIRWLGEVEKLASEVTKQQLARLENLERVLWYIGLQKEKDTHNETYQKVCIIFLENIILVTRAAVISKARDHMSQGKSDLPEILQVKDNEMKSYLENVEGKIDEINDVIKEIAEKASYFFTEKIDYICQTYEIR